MVFKRKEPLLTDETDVEKIHTIIECEHAAKLTRHVNKAKKQRRKCPGEVEVTYTNSVIAACQLRLAALAAPSANEGPDPTTQLTSHSCGTSPGADPPSITGQSSPDTCTTEVEATGQLANTANDVLLVQENGSHDAPSPTRSPSPAHSALITTAPSLPSLRIISTPLLPCTVTDSLNGQDPSLLPSLHTVTNALNEHGSSNNDINVGDPINSATLQPTAADPLVSEPTDPGNKKKKCEHRPGLLTKEQLEELQEKKKEIHCWITEKTQAWGVSAVTITTNMGLDNHEKQALNFWNAFQCVFWHREMALNEASVNPGEEVPDLDMESWQKCCHEEYLNLSIPDNVTDKQIEEIKTKRKEILEKYEALQEPDDLEYKEGSTSSLMKQARQELTNHAGWFAARGVLLGGFGVSIDPCDPVSHTLYSVFAGSDIIWKFFDEMRRTWRNSYMISRHCAKKSDDIRKENSVLLRQLWGKAMNEPCTKVPWDNWAADLIKKKKKTIGWPDGVIWPSGPKAYSLLPHGEPAHNLRAALIAPDNKRVKIIDWNAEHIALEESLPYAECDTNNAYKTIPLIISQSSQVLLCIGEMKDQATLCSGRPAKESKLKKNSSLQRKLKRRDEREQVDSDSNDSDASISSSGSSKSRKKGKKKEVKQKSIKEKFAKKRKDSASEPVIARIQPKSQKVIDDSNNDLTECIQEAAPPLVGGGGMMPLAASMVDERNDTGNADKSQAVTLQVPALQPSYPSSLLCEVGAAWQSSYEAPQHTGTPAALQGTAVIQQPRPPSHGNSAAAPQHHPVPHDNSAPIKQRPPSHGDLAAALQPRPPSHVGAAITLQPCPQSRGNSAATLQHRPTLHGNSSAISPRPPSLAGPASTYNPVPLQRPSRYVGGTPQVGTAAHHLAHPPSQSAVFTQAPPRPLSLTDPSAAAIARAPSRAGSVPVVAHYVDPADDPWQDGDREDDLVGQTEYDAQPAYPTQPVHQPHPTYQIQPVYQPQQSQQQPPTRMAVQPSSYGANHNAWDRWQCLTTAQYGSERLGYYAEETGMSYGNQQNDTAGSDPALRYSHEEDGKYLAETWGEQLAPVPEEQGYMDTHT
ncbi:hypothetical protein M422DRAFT_49369 [Sphaerobolus stellatus SS14]|uniref:Uncharacterized protein n=1 Tax=Sphaerobolus stellatus (strain SS14) TaxID=990650 RepID=A0A0C9UAC4_SPHS4|nr:hypothetical protein M422DRAFT_49369 [Sphaerobolus stellatus SS14]